MSEHIFDLDDYLLLIINRNKQPPERDSMINQFRKRWNGVFDDRDDAASALANRSDGKVALWSLERSVAVLQSSARSSFKINDPGEVDLTHQEQSLIETISALQANDLQRATIQAQWLVTGDAIGLLLRSLEPLARTVRLKQSAAA